MYRGNFEIEDYVIERRPLSHAQIDGDRISLSDAPGQPPRLILTLAEDAIKFDPTDPKLNRLWVRIKADDDENVWGGGEQMSYFDMRGRRFPLWTSEPGVGRDPTSEITFKANVKDKAGGDYYNTNYPQPTYVSSALYALHVETTAYSVFDFRQKAFHEIEVWAIPKGLSFLLPQHSWNWSKFSHRASGGSLRCRTGSTMVPSSASKTAKIPSPGLKQFAAQG